MVGVLPGDREIDLGVGGPPGGDPRVAEQAIRQWLVHPAGIVDIVVQVERGYAAEPPSLESAVQIHLERAFQ